MNGRYILSLALLLAPGLVIAEEPSVYESFAGVQIGRVFLAPGDRDRLDEQRLNPPAEGAVASSTAEDTSQKRRPTAAAGYIISSSGRARVWHDGDFVESRQPSPHRMDFPGDVKVTRAAVAETASPSTKEDQRERDEADSRED